MKNKQTPMSKILLIDDHSSTRLILKRHLSEQYEVFLAKDGGEGLQLAIQERPALIICDWMMPVMDGIELCCKIKRDPDLASTFFILLTSKGELADRVRGLDAGADDFLSKPVEQSELLARVRAGLRLHQSQNELREANLQASTALRELQQTQAQLIQSEKMSSLGKLVAGIAHEINNPVTFIHGNLGHATTYFKELAEFADFSRHRPDPEIEALAQQMDLDFALQDFPKVLTSMQNGAERIRKIVCSLHNFSRLDQAQMKVVDIHQGIDSTLLILQNRLVDIEVIQKYGHLPKVECYPGDFNQVLLNVLNNAIDSIHLEENLKEKSASGCITISTSVLDKQIEIIIADNGAGIPERILPRIFDPFFTTKPVGEGKGLGLTTSYQIVVEKHGGELKCFSQVGIGSEFAIAIPISQTACQLINN